VITRECTTRDKTGARGSDPTGTTYIATTSYRACKQGAYFFVLDAFIGSIIIIAAIVVLYSGFTSREQADRQFYAAEDFMGVMETTQIRNYGYESGTIKTMIANKDIADTKLTLLQQLVLFYNDHNYANATAFALELANRTPERTGISICITHDGVCETPLVQIDETYGRADIPPASDATAIYSSQRIVVLRIASAGVPSTAPPVIVEVKTWQ